MGISTDRISRQDFIFTSILIMILGLFTSRVLLSAGMIGFLLFTCLHKQFTGQLKTLVRNPFLIGICLLFLIPFITWFWSEDKTAWLRWERIKLPLLLLPIGFAGNWQLSQRQWRWAGLLFIFLVFTGCCWSLWQYIQNYPAIHESYLRAKVIATPLGNDHVRFSLLVAIGIICSSFFIAKDASKYLKIALIILSIFFVVYLHILSARTGLFSFYIFLFLLLVHLLVSMKSRKWSLMIGLAIVLLPLAAWLLLPTFQNRIKYIIYDFSFIRRDEYLPGANDGNRILSLRAGWDILKENPLGVGSGDVVNTAYDWYRVHVPQMRESDKLYPSSEWLLYGDSAGWPGLVIFTAVMVVPLFLRMGRTQLFWISLNTITAFSLLFDIGLETQFGVFIYAFIILWWWKWLLSLHSNRANDPGTDEKVPTAPGL